MHRRLIPSSVLLPLALILVIGLQSACATRTVRSKLVENSEIQVDLIREVEILTTKPRGFEHPAIISKPRLTHILGAIEIETQDDEKGSLREPAFHRDIIDRSAEALAKAFAEVGPDQEISIRVIRKEMSLGILNQKYLTSFLAYIDNEHLYLTMRRVEWLLPKGRNLDSVPKPQHGTRPMTFRVVSGEPLFYAGPQTLEIAWRDPAFQTSFRLPGSTGGTKRRREVLLKSPIPSAELDAEFGTGEGVRYDELSPEQLRALANLEEDRRNGAITETTYQRGKRQLLRRR